MRGNETKSDEDLLTVLLHHMEKESYVYKELRKGVCFDYVGQREFRSLSQARRLEEDITRAILLSCYILYFNLVDSAKVCSY